MMELDQAIDLIKKGRKKEVQTILYNLIHSHPHEIQVWFWYVEALDTLEKRVQCLTACLKENPGNVQVVEALKLLQARQVAHSQPVLEASGSSFHAVRYDEPKESHQETYSELDSNEEENRYSQHEPNGISSMPDINIPANQNVIAYLKDNLNIAAVFPYQNKMISSYQNIWEYDRYPNICDVMDYFIKTADGLPEGTTYLVYGWTALVHPVNGRIFGFVKGDTHYYRLPQKAIKELLGRKKIAAYQINHPKLGAGWVSSLMGHTYKFVNKVYEYNGGSSNNNAAPNLNVQEDFVSQSSQDQVQGWNLIYVVIFLLLIFLLGAFTAYLRLRGRGILP